MKVGDYVRTKDGVIDKIGGYRYESEYENGHVVWFKKNDSGCRFADKNLPKSSPNIIDLIEIGDYVNGERVIYKQYKEYPNPLLNQYVVDTIRCSYQENEIKSIVTQEQFKQMEYKIGGNDENND